MAEKDEVPRGPEDMPLRSYVAKHNIVILVIDVKSKMPIREERINYSDPELRRWLGKITYWATTNGYMVQTCAEADYVREV